MQPRPYQTECVNAIWDYFVQGGTGNPLVAMPTGTGKSLIPPLVMERALRQFPDQRMILLTHVKELVEQNYKTLHRVWPTAPVGIFSAGLGRKEAYAPLVFGGIASVKNSIREIGHRDILWIDEAHLLGPNESSMYRTVIDDLRQINPYIRMVGLSATPFRMGQGRLTDITMDRDGKEIRPLFTDLVFDITGVQAFNRLIDEYYLSPLIPKQTQSVIDVSDVRILQNDFNQHDLHEAIARQNITERALREACEIAYDRKSWIVFGAGIRNCEQITGILNRMGIPTTYVHSKLDDDSRDNRIEAFKAGRFRAIVSNNILTTGFDHPEVDCIVDLRPTTSVVLHVQKYGRGTRPVYHPSFSFDQLAYIEHRKTAIEMGGKRNCIVLDFAGNTNRLGPINDPQIPKRKGKRTGEIPVKLCPQCGAYNHTTARFCCDSSCGYEFVFKTKIKSSASTADIIRRDDPNFATVPVTSVIPGIHKKLGKPDSLKLMYFSGLNLYNVWLSFESPSGLAKHKSHEWWRQHQGDEIPTTTKEAYDRFRSCRTARQIKVDISGKYPEVVEYLF